MVNPAKSNSKKVEKKIQKVVFITRKQTSQLMRKIALDFLRNVVLTTPVDTGRARANWNTATKNVNLGVGKAGDPSGATALAGGLSSLASYEPGDGIFVSNNLDYIQDLNAGSSRQAPAKFVQAAFAQAIAPIEGTKFRIAT